MFELRDKVARHVLQKSWPKGRDFELLTAILSADDHQALANWRHWLSQTDIEIIDWQDHRMLAAFVGRLRKLDPQYPQLARLEGLAKSHWTSSQLIRRQTLRAVDILIAHKIPCMLFKGIAFEISGYSHIPGRFSGDLDVLVPRKMMKRALNLLYENGWHVPGRSADQVLVRLSKKLGMNLTHADGGDFDLHHQPIHAGYTSNAALDLLWQNATSSKFLGRDIFIPSLPDLIAISASHGMRFPPGSKKRAHLWAIDFVNGIGRLGSDFAELAKSAENLKVEASVCAALGFGLKNFKSRFPAAKVETYLKQQIPKSSFMWFALEAQSSNIVTEATKAIGLGFARRRSRIPLAEFGS